MNPILARELRGRFRDKRSYWLLFGVSALLGLAAALLYANAISADVPVYGGPGYGGVRDAETRTGRELFRFLALGNMLAWLLIAPALTATGLAKERERGLLESLWLSPFRVAAQVWGRLGAALCFLGVLQIAILPTYGIAVLLGGVSPSDIALSSLIIAMGAFAGASFGLWCSARSYRGSGALGAAFFGIAAWSALAIFAFAEAPAATTPFNFLLVFSHPVALLWLLLSPADLSVLFLGKMLLTDARTLAYGLSLQFAVSLLLMWIATRSAAKALPEMRWSQGNERLRKWRARVETARQERQERREAARTRETVASALLYEVPVEKFVRFKDPLLAREVRGRFRLRRGGAMVSTLRFLTLLTAICFWLAIAYSALDASTRVSAGQSIMIGFLSFGTLAIGVMSSGAVVREREAGTWEGLHLSLMSPWQIVRAKWLSPLATLAYWSAPFWILMPLYFNFPSFGALIIVVATLSTVSAWGLYVSGRAPHSAAATSWTLASLLVVLVALPALDAIFDVGRTVGRIFHPDLVQTAYSTYNAYPTSYNSIDENGLAAFQALWNSYHPFISISNLFERYSGLDDGIRVEIVALSVVFNALVTAILLWSAWRRGRKTEF